MPVKQSSIANFWTEWVIENCLMVAERHDIDEELRANVARKYIEARFTEAELFDDTMELAWQIFQEVNQLWCTYSQVLSHDQ